MNGIGSAVVIGIIVVLAVCWMLGVIWVLLGVYRERAAQRSEAPRGPEDSADWAAYVRNLPKPSG